MKSKAFDHSKYAHWIDPNAVVPYEKNAKIHTDKQIKNIVNSIKRFGWQQDTVIAADNVLVIGHGRRLAAIKLGCEMPYHVIDKTADELTDDDIRELRIADNQTNAETGFDFDALADDIDGLDFEGFDFDFGIEMEEQDEEPIDIVEDELPTETETRCKVGDLWQLGEHRLICGDSTDVAVIDRLMDGVKANMVFTDPPYGMSLDTDYSSVLGRKKLQAKFIKEKGIKGGRDYEKVKGDNTDFTPELVTTIFSNFDYCKEIFIWGCDYYPDLIKGFKDGCCMVWDKKANDGVTTNMTEAYTSDFELVWSKNKHKKSIIRVLWALVFGTEQEFDHKRYHPTQKPTKLSRWFIERFSEEQQIVVDLYGGSGSTLIACEQLNRKCYMAELDPHYCDVILQRYINLKGSDADVFMLKDGEKIPYSDVKS